ncbi:hypothetical protein Acr_26g0004420 [Actinidia rufa]|uniref:Uncharacterized protein n=1 Tax=Actinidia rufa TaxID=165716 RepID=A0A7J0H2B1_9ERIC|nr:hypothetical protein Acr_26g0004420 [Actinidia rufa]
MPLGFLPTEVRRRDTAEFAIEQQSGCGACPSSAIAGRPAKFICACKLSQCPWLSFQCHASVSDLLEARLGHRCRSVSPTLRRCLARTRGYQATMCRHLIG